MNSKLNTPFYYCFLTTSRKWYVVLLSCMKSCRVFTDYMTDDMVDFPKQCWLWGNGLILTPRGSANALLFILFYYTKHSQVCPLHGVKSHIVWQLLCFKFGLMYLVSWLSHMKWTIPVWRLMKSSLLEVLVLLICVHQGWDGSAHIIWVNLTIWGTTLRIVLSTQNW